MSKTAAYGGTFDPPTFGHLTAIQTLVANGYQVIIHPVGESHAFGKKMSPAALRMSWMKAFILEAQNRQELPPKGIEVVDLYDFGAKRDETSTYAMLPALRRAGLAHFGTRDIALTIGSDQANCLDRWEKPEVLKKGKLIIIERLETPLSDEAKVWAKEHTHLTSQKSTGYTSSSLVRRLIAEGKFVEAHAHTYPSIVDGWVNR